MFCRDETFWEGTTFRRRAWSELVGAWDKHCCGWVSSGPLGTQTTRGNNQIPTDGRGMLVLRRALAALLLDILALGASLSFAPTSASAQAGSLGTRSFPLSVLGVSAMQSNRMSTFEPSLGLTRSQVEQRFREIDGSHTVFKTASSVDGMPRVLGSDKRLYTIVEINGYPEVTDVQVVSVLDAASKTTLENLVIYDSLACGVLADEAAQNWCTSRVLDTNSEGLVTATKAADFGPVRISVKTYQDKKSSSPALVSINVMAA